MVQAGKLHLMGAAANGVLSHYSPSSYLMVAMLLYAGLKKVTLVMLDCTCMLGYLTLIKADTDS